MKKRLIGIGIVVVLFLVLLFIPTKKLSIEAMNELIVKSSMLYADCLIKTEALQEQANLSYEEASAYISDVADQRELVYELTKELESESDKLANISRGQVAAYDAQDITNIIDKAPPGKKIKTLAKELNISAEKAFKLLKMSQQQLTADAWNQAGDTFETLENTAKVIKDGCKVGLMIGWSVIAGPASAAIGTLDKAAMIINGVDLALQIGEDVSNIALGYNNQVAAVFGDVRKITEPGTAIIGFAGLYNAGNSAMDMINAITYTIEATNDLIQEGKVMGIKIKDNKTELITMNNDEVNTRAQDNGILTTADKAVIMGEIAQLVQTITEQEKTQPQEKISEEKISEEKTNKDIYGEWEVNIPVNGEIINGGTYTINEDGTMKLEADGQSRTATRQFTDDDTIEAIDPRDGGKMILTIKDDSIEWSQIQYGDQTTDAGGVTLTRGNNSQPIEEDTDNGDAKKSLAGTSREIIDGSTYGFMEFTETEMKAWVLVNWEKMGNTVTMQYSYSNGKGHYGSDDPKAVQRVEIVLKGDTLILTTKQGQRYEYHRVQ